MFEYKMEKSHKLVSVMAGMALIISVVALVLALTRDNSCSKDNYSLLNECKPETGHEKARPCRCNASGKRCARSLNWTGNCNCVSTDPTKDDEKACWKDLDCVLSDNETENTTDTVKLQSVDQIYHTANTTQSSCHN